MYEIKYKELPNNLIIVKIELKTKTIIYVNKKKIEHSAKRSIKSTENKVLGDLDIIIIW